MWHWLLTSSTYGAWLPGDRRGSVTSVRDYRSSDPATPCRVEHDRPGEAWEPPAPGLRRSAAAQMRDPAVLLEAKHAEALLFQLQESSTYRGWSLHAAAIMPNHFHLVVSVEADTDPAKMLQTFKSYGSRRLNEEFGKPPSGTWWTKHGSKRKLPDGVAVAAAVNYVLHKQPNPLVTLSSADRSD